MNLAYQSAFAIPVNTGFGYAEVPYTAVPWDGTTLSGGSPSVTGGIASFAVTAGSAGRFGQVLDLGSTDGELFGTTSLDIVPLGASALVVNRFGFRIQDSSNLYTAGWYVNNTGAVKARIQKVVAGVSSNIQTGGVDITVSATYTPGDKYNLDLLYVGTSIQIWVWKVGTSKPGTPTCTATDSTYTTGTKFALMSNGNGSTTTSTVHGQWSYMQAFTPNPTFYTTPAPIIGSSSIPSGVASIGLAPDALTKFWSSTFTAAADYHAGSGALNAALLTRETQLGRRIDNVHAFVSWDQWATSATQNIKNNLANIVNGGRNLLISIFDISNAPADWKAGTIAGTYDSVYTTLVDYLVSLAPRNGQIIIRLSWEANLSNWGTDPAGFKAYWNYVLTLMKSHDSGNLIKFFWCLSHGGSPLWTDFWDNAWDAGGTTCPDFVGFDRYHVNPDWADIRTMWTETSTANPSNSNFYQTFLSKGKPYLQGETGTRQQSDPSLPAAQPRSAAQWYYLAPDAPRNLLNFKGMFIWDKSDSNKDYHIDNVAGPDTWPASDPVTFDATSANATFVAAKSLFYVQEFGGAAPDPYYTPPGQQTPSRNVFVDDIQLGAPGMYIGEK